MALVRVYCGLASAEPSQRPVTAGPTLTAAVVDDAGRLLDVFEVGDDPAGYAELGALLVERSSGSGVAIAADSDDHVVTSLLATAGRPIAIADDDAADDYAERFADDESLDEMESSEAERRAVGLARALQAGALSAITLPTPRDLIPYKPVLAAHAALAGGRHAAAATLREVLRELYPAALRAYPDPAEPLALAVLDALPEPGMLVGTGPRGREASSSTDAIAARLAEEGVAEATAVAEAITALRVAIAETPRRGTVGRTLANASAEAVRQAVAAVRSCDAGCTALVATLAARTSATASRHAGRRTAVASASVPAPGLHAVPPPIEPVVLPSRRQRQQPAAASAGPASPRPLTTPPTAPPPVTPPPVAPSPIAPAARLAPEFTAPVERPGYSTPPERAGNGHGGAPLEMPTFSRRNAPPAASVSPAPVVAPPVAPPAPPPAPPAAHGSAPLPTRPAGRTPRRRRRPRPTARRCRATVRSPRLPRHRPASRRSCRCSARARPSSPTSRSARRSPTRRSTRPVPSAAGPPRSRSDR